ncbi:MAG: hypothetical protein ACR2KT_10665, partial [Methylocella sp.]
LPLARVTASNSLDERSAPIKPTPRRPKSPTVPPQANIFRGAPDIFDALTAYRPYRASIPISKSLAIMSQSVGTAIDPDCFNALRHAMGSLDVSLAA